MPSIALDADPPALLGHPEDESPAILGVEVGVGQHQQALVLLQLDIFLQVIEDMPSMELLDLGIRTHPRVYYFLLLKLGEALFDSGPPS